MGYAKDTGKALGIGLGAIIAICVVIAIFTAFGLALYSQALPWQQKIERETTQQSRQYVESKQTFLLGLTQDVRRLEAEKGSEAQISATIDRMETEAALLPASEVPPSVTATLARYGR
jgi:hypothetical protein